ncbi:MAG: LysE family transporter [Hyphomicrobiales bacterium]|nr:LysE family transporter [Hyphomicrobiales bacterium]
MSPAIATLATGFLLGWSVAWPPGPINAEIARRCVARGYWAGFSLGLGACTGDAIWAVLVSLGIGAFFSGDGMRRAMGYLSVALLLLLAFMFLRGAWRAWRTAPGEAPKRFDSARAGYLLGATMALTSPFNLAFWIAAMGRPDLAGAPLVALPLTAGSVLLGALSWDVVWSGAATLLKARTAGGPGRAWSVGVELATGALMLWFAWGAATRLAGG